MIQSIDVGRMILDKGVIDLRTYTGKGSGEFDVVVNVKCKSINDAQAVMSDRHTGTIEKEVEIEKSIRPDADYAIKVHCKDELTYESLSAFTVEIDTPYEVEAMEIC